MKAIVAVTSNWGIGKDNQLLISIPEDMKFFRETTKNSVVIMGRKTLESFPGGKPLKNRINIVITRDEKYAPEGAVVVHDVDEAVKETKKYNDMEKFVIGGASVYQQMVDLCDEVYVTKVETLCDADAYFPNMDEKKEFAVIYESDEKEYEGISFKFVTYAKINR